MTGEAAEDPFDDQRRELLERMMFEDLPRDEWSDLNARWTELDVPSDDRYAIRFPGPPRHFDETATCVDCGRTVGASGIRYGDDEYDTPLCLAVHWSEDCPALKHRAWRFWHVHTGGRLERRLLHRKMRKGRKGT